MTPRSAGIVAVLAVLLAAASCAPLPKGGPNPESDTPTSATRLPNDTPPRQDPANPPADGAPRPRPAPTGGERPVRGAYTSGPTASGARAGADAAGAHDFDHVSLADAEPRVEPRSKFGNPPKYKVFGVEYAVLASSKGYKERGIASWYGAKFHGARTSSGEAYDMYAMSAAHKTLPLPTYARVTNLDNGKSVIVRINDRGPFKQNRVMDLSYAAALKLEIVANGTGKVEIEAIDPVEWARTNAAFDRALAANDAPPTPAGGEAGPVGRAAPGGITPTAAPPAITTAAADAAAAPMWLQLGAFGDRARAEQLAAHLKRTGVGDAVLIDGANAAGNPLTKVRLGPYTTVEALDTATKRLDALGHRDYQLVIE